RTCATLSAPPVRPPPANPAASGRRPSPAHCSLFTPDPATTRTTPILDFTTNVGQDATDGVDLAMRYAYPSEYGRFGFLFDGTWLHKYDRTLANGSVIAGRGTYDLGSANGGTGGVYPAFKFNSGVSWSLGGL